MTMTIATLSHRVDSLIKQIDLLLATCDEVCDALSKNHEKPKNTDIMKELARRWKDLTDQDKEPWNANAKEL